MPKVNYTFKQQQSNGSAMFHSFYFKDTKIYVRQKSKVFKGKHHNN